MFYSTSQGGEENPAFSVPFNGSPFTVLREVMIPCVDALERNVPNAYFPRIASSLAAQFGDGRCLCEALGGSGWGVEPDQFTRYVNHLADCGITGFAMHIQQLKLDSTSKTDWPPSQPLHLGWKDAYASVLQEIRPTNRHADTLAVAPMRGVSAVYSARERVCTNVHNACVQPNTPATALSRDFIQMTSGLQDFHVTDEKQFECGALARQIGQCTYRHVVIHKGCLFARKPEQTAFTVQQPEENLLVYPDGDGRELAGKFLVLSRNGYVDDGEVLHTAFDFFTQPEGLLDASNLTASGLPFCNVPVAMEKEFVLDRDYPHAIYFFEQFHADCARVYVDGADAGFYWSNRENTMPFPLAAGRHCLKIWLYPSAFNRFGPHNHIDGDVYTCSPGQFTGEKNFADRQDAPLNTRTPEIHVKKFGIGALAVF